MDIDKMRCSVEINLTQFLRNYELVKGCLPRGCLLMAVLKGNAYGHGAAEIAKRLEGYEEDWIAVASLGEALEIRDAGVKKNILILGYTAPKDAAILAEKQITQALISWEYGADLAKEAEKAGVIVSCHLAVDTGMSRIGLMAYGEACEESITRAIALYRNPALQVGGIFTHFSSAYGSEEDDRQYTQTQYRRFQDFCNALTAAGICVGLRHCCNSGSIINYPEYAMDMCRGGTLLFGFLDASIMNRPLDLQTVMQFRTTVCMVKEIEPGAAVSYNRTVIANKRMKLAVLSAGWYDGYPRLLGNRGIVLIRGQRFPIVGKICMDICMADITGHDEIRPGDEAVLLGKQGDEEIKVIELYQPLGIGPGSIGSGISQRVPRIYTE